MKSSPSWPHLVTCSRCFNQDTAGARFCSQCGDSILIDSTHGAVPGRAQPGTGIAETSGDTPPQAETFPETVLTERLAAWSNSSRPTASKVSEKSANTDAKPLFEAGETPTPAKETESPDDPWERVRDFGMAGTTLIWLLGLIFPPALTTIRLATEEGEAAKIYFEIFVLTAPLTTALYLVLTHVLYHVRKSQEPSYAAVQGWLLLFLGVAFIFNATGLSNDVSVQVAMAEAHGSGLIKLLTSVGNLMSQYFEAYGLTLFVSSFVAAGFLAFTSVDRGLSILGRRSPAQD